MAVKNLLATLFDQPSGAKLREDIARCAQVIHQNPQESLIPDVAFSIVGINPHMPEIPDRYVMEKELYYFEKCSQATRNFHEREFTQAIDLLMKAKGDFDHWALAHYLLGLGDFEWRDVKAALDQFNTACMNEPYNGRPMEIMRELTYAILMN
mgnify:CR=1 FL=1